MKDALFEGYDFSVLDSKEFKEEAVREDIIAPILKKLGYRSYGHNRIARGKHLTHPYVMLGSQKKSVNIIPDYILTVEDKPVFIIEAKKPTENIYSGDHVEQAFSYAIHPEIRVQYYGLCNGRNLVAFQIDNPNPMFDVAVSEMDYKWDVVYKLLSPFGITHPDHRLFAPDLGLTMKQMGFTPVTNFVFILVHLEMILKEADNLYLFMSKVTIGEVDYLATIDVDKNTFSDFLGSLPPNLKAAISNGLSRQPFNVRLDHYGIYCDLEATLSGEIICGMSEEKYIPLQIRQITKIYIDNVKS